MTEKWGKIKLSKFELSGFYCIGGTCERLFIILFHSLKGKPCFPLGRGFCRSFSQRVLYAWAFFGLISCLLPSLPPPPFPFTHSMFLTQQFSFGNFNLLLKVLSFWVFTDCQSRVFSCARRTSWGITSCSCYFYHYRHPHCWAKHFCISYLIKLNITQSHLNLPVTAWVDPNPSGLWLLQNPALLKLLPFWCFILWIPS